MKATLTQQTSKWLASLLTILSPLLWAGAATALLTACSEETDQSGEFDNWQQRNDAYFNALADSLSAAPAQWQRLKCYALDPATDGNPTDYVYVKVIKTGDGTIGSGGETAAAGAAVVNSSTSDGVTPDTSGLPSPMYTDSVRVSYQGRLIPSATYPQGYVFDGTVYGTYDDRTNATSRQKLSTMIDGYVTAILHMHRGDHWRVYIPAALAYGDTGSGTAIPAYSVVIFDITLIDFASTGESLPAYNARRLR